MAFLRVAVTFLLHLGSWLYPLFMPVETQRFSSIMHISSCRYFLDHRWYRKCLADVLACTFRRPLASRKCLINECQVTTSSLCASHYCRWIALYFWSCMRSYTCACDSITVRLNAQTCNRDGCCRYWFLRTYASKFLVNFTNYYFYYNTFSQ